jgi:hypothetical protein
VIRCVTVFACYSSSSSGDQGKPGEPGHRNIGRGSCRSALADPVSNAGQQQWYGGYPCTPDGGPMGHSARSTVTPPPHPPLQSASEGIGGARGLGNLVRPESHPEPRGFPVQWADPGVKLASKPSSLPVRPRPRTRVATSRSGCSHRFTGRLYPCSVCLVNVP